MNRRVPIVAISCAAALLAPVAAAKMTTGKTGLARTPLAVGVPRYGIFERAFRWPSRGYSNPWEQVSLSMTLTSPSGRRTRVDGFYFAANTWKVRFSPTQAGRWRWVARLRDATRVETSRGAFTVSRSTGHGFVRRSPYNRFRWIFADGQPYYPIGIGDCVRDDNRSGAPFDDFNIDGNFAKDTDERSRVSIGRYLTAYQRAGVNLFRWSVDNCAFGLYRTIAPDGNVYLEREGHWGDQFVRHLRSHGLRVYMTIFGFSPPFANEPTAEQIAAVERYVRYVVARYGAYVDYWELMNEARASTAWYMEVARYLRSVDPYRHPIATSWERPDLPVIDVNAPHWYEKEVEFDSDARTWHAFAGWRAAGKPVIVGEQGNSGQNWDERSALRMRLRVWTAFFAEGTLVFWNTSSRKDYRALTANIYLGPEERQYLRVLQRFTRGFDARARIVPVRVSAADVRGYALGGPREYGAYLHAFQNHASPTSGLHITVQSRAAGTATWISPAAGRVVARTTVRRGTQNLAVPPFVTDLALKVRFRLR